MITTHTQFDPQFYIESVAAAGTSAVIFTLIGWLSHFLYAHLLVYQQLHEGQKKEWRARTVALIHSIAAIALASKAVWQFPHNSSEMQQIFGSTPELRLAASVSCGYFLWDAVINIWHWRSPGTDYFAFQGLLHGSVCFFVYIASLRPFGLCVTALHLLFEFSTPFLHIRWFLIKLGYASSAIGVTNDYAFVLVFFVARVLMGPFYAYWYFSLMPFVPFSPFHLVFLPSTLISNGLNFFWFYLILQSALVATPTEKKQIGKKKKKRSRSRTSSESKSPAPPRLMQKNANHEVDFIQTNSRCNSKPVVQAMPVCQPVTV
uniref:TLC domain-containing protein n=1 Tax=Vannella robusta TaxID=1487602 RepID=A0A7S4IKV5_9EUKA|mmetsp:Transcript_4284/g.5285  ORF Transcript_4284/g.5285 Transcript_4284/m.5285 type:complete len:318 (+) Transcript_4284:16-969(+)